MTWCQTLISDAVAPPGYVRRTDAASSIPGYPNTDAVWAETDSAGPRIQLMTSRSWIECSMSVPPPALSTSLRQVEPYIPWIGKYWSSRRMSAIGLPKRPDPTASAACRNTGAWRSTSPTWCGTESSSDAIFRQSSIVGASGFSQKTARPRSTAACTAGRWPAVHVQIQATSTASSASSIVAAGVARFGSAILAARSGSTSKVVVMSASISWASAS